MSDNLLRNEIRIDLDFMPTTNSYINLKPIYKIPHTKYGQLEWINEVLVRHSDTNFQTNNRLAFMN